MRHLTPLVICLACLLPLALLAQDAPIKFGKIPKEDLQMKSYSLDTSAAAVVLCDFGSLRFQFKDDSPFSSLTRHKRIKILRRAGFQHGDVVIPYYTSLMRIRSLKAQVFAPDGTETEVPKKDIFDEKVNENWSRIRFAFPNLSEGCVVEYKYELETDYIFELPEWYFQGEIPTRWSELQLVIPLWYRYVTLTNGRQPEIVETKEMKENFIISSGTGSTSSGTVNATHIRLAMKDLPAFKEEAYITTMEDYYSRVRFQLKSIQYSDEADPKQIMSTWPQTATKLFEDEKFGLQFTKKSKYKKAWEAAQPHIAAAKTPDEKIEAVYQFVQRSIECEGGYPTYYARKDLDDLFEKKSASASEMNLLIVALLRESGVQASPVLISTRDHGQPVTEYPIMDQFNHVLALAETGDKSVFLDAGNSFRPPGMIAVNALNREGWKVHATQPQWMPLTPTMASETYFGVFQLDEEGNMTGKIQTTEEGYSAMERRFEITKKPAAEYWKTEIQKRYPDATLDSMTVENKDDMKQPLAEKFNCTLPNYAQVSGDFIYLNPAFYSDYHENPFKLEHRMCPVDIPHPLKERVVFNLDIPAGYKVESLPESARFALPSNKGRFQYIIEQKDGKVTLNASMTLAQLRFSTEEYDGLRSFFGMIAEKYGEQIVLKKG
jgi:hypothetical protein